MKTIRLTALLMGTCLLFSGCPGASFFGHDPIFYGLSLSFQDASGKDLVEGIRYIQTNENFETGEVEPALYGLSIFINKKKVHSTMYYTKGYADSTIPYSTLSVSLAERESKITFAVLLSCPYIFGDDAEHEITSYLKKKGGAYVHTRLTFDGKDIDTTKQEYNSAYATIVLD